jgi:hypothetical protein
MKTQPTKIAHRGHLKNLVKKGLIEVKCDFHYTDDYVMDAANDHGKTDWMPAVFTDAYKYSSKDEQQFKDWDFGTSSGYLYARENGFYSFAIHSNLVYTVRIKEAV